MFYVFVVIFHIFMFMFISIVYAASPQYHITCCAGCYCYVTVGTVYIIGVYCRRVRVVCCE